MIDENDQQVGIMDTARALSIAQSKELDLVEVYPLAHPPVCKLLDYGKYQYRQEKAERKHKAKQKKIEVKGIRLSLRISDHDFGVKLQRAEKFLAKGNKIKINLLLRGRERTHEDLARELIQKFIDALKDRAKIEQPVQRQGGMFNTILTPIT